MTPAARRRTLWLLAGLLVGAPLLVVLWLPPPGQGVALGPTPLDYVGVGACEACHAEETKRWRGSLHDLAMQPANEATVLGDFDAGRFQHQGVVTRFSRRDGKYFVHTDGPDGRLADYPVAYVFGVTPLQQYLVEQPGGRFQALSVAWDSRPKPKAGQHFFHLYPKERIDFRDVLHWTKPSQNWNTQWSSCK